MALRFVFIFVLNLLTRYASVIAYMKLKRRGSSTRCHRFAKISGVINEEKG